MSILFDRTGKKTSLIACTRADPVSSTPLAVIAREAREAELMECGFSQDGRLIAHYESDFVNSVLFFHWVMNMFVSQHR
jgi:hypothetical protein